MRTADFDTCFRGDRSINQAMGLGERTETLAACVDVSALPPFPHAWRAYAYLLDLGAAPEHSAGGRLYLSRRIVQALTEPT